MFCPSTGQRSPLVSPSSGGRSPAPTLIGSALLALAGAASAQSNVTLFGVIDTDLTYGKGSLTSVKAVGTGGYAGSRIGVRGVEDLGGGLRAAFVVEHGFSSDTGTQATSAAFWNRQTHVGLSGPWGELQLGRIYTPSFLVHATYDAFGPQGAAAQHVLLTSMELAQPTNIRATNAINYNAAGALGGFILQAMVSAAEGAATGKYSGVRAGYAAGNFSGEAAYGVFDDAAIGDLKAVTIGARYRIGAFTLYGLVNNADSGTSFDTRGMQVSAAYQIGTTTLKASIAQSRRRSAAGADVGSNRRVGIGAVYDLSKRTALYTSMAHVDNSDGASLGLNGATTAVNKGASGIDVGIRHTF